MGLHINLWYIYGRYFSPMEHQEKEHGILPNIPSVGILKDCIWKKQYQELVGFWATHVKHMPKSHWIIFQKSEVNNLKDLKPPAR